MNSSLLARNLGCTSVRSISSKYVKPHPRPHRRRLYEAVVAPIMPPEARKPCINYYEQEKRRQEEEKELALTQKVRGWIEDEKFRVYCVCHYNIPPSRAEHFARNQLRLKGIEMKTYPARIMAKVFEGTPLDVLTPLYIDDQFCQLYGRDINAVKAIARETARIPFIFPLAITFDDRILSVEEIKALSELDDPEQLRAQTVQMLQHFPAQLTQSIDHHTRDLTSILSRIGTAAS